MSTAIEWNLGLPCPNQRDAIVASVVDGGQAHSLAATTDHLRRCAACRAFRDSLRTQRVLVRRVTELQQEELRQRTRQRQFAAEVREWVNEELKVRGERELATALWRCAAAIFRFDPRAARATRHEEGPAHTEDPVYSNCVAALRLLLDGNIDSTTLARRHRLSRRENIANCLRSIESIDRESRSRQIQVMQVLLNFADEISPHSASLVATTRGLIAWYHEDERDVRRFLDRALEASETSHQCGQSISNLALWSSTKGSFDDAIALGHEAIRANDYLAFPRANLAIWSAAVGDARNADRFLSQAATLVGIEIFRDHWPWSFLQGALDACLTLTGASVREHRRSVDSFWIAYHRSGGLIPAPRVRRATIESETGF